MIHSMLETIGIAIIGFSIILGGLFGATPPLGATVPVTVAIFETSLATGISSSATSMTLNTGTDKSGDALSGYTCFAIDEGTASEEFVCGTAAGTAITSIVRGIDPVDGDLSVTALKKAHRRGASVKITNHPALAIISRIINGNETFPNKISYASQPSFTGDEEIITKKYVDDVALASAPDASVTVKGVTEEGTTAEIDAGTAAGGTSARLFVNPNKLASSIYNTQLPSSDQKNALAGTSGTPSTSNKYVTDDDIAQANIPTADEKAALAGTGTPNVSNEYVTDDDTSNSTTADKVVRYTAGGDVNVPTTPVDGNDATSKTYVDTNFVSLFSSGVAQRAFSTASGNQVIAHGLGKTPKKVRISAYASVGTTTAKEASSMGSYDGTNNVSVYVEQDNNGDISKVQSDGSNSIVMIWGSNGNDSQKAVITVDGTNITIAWTKVGTTSTVTIHFMWEVEG